MTEKERRKLGDRLHGIIRRSLSNLNSTEEICEVLDVIAWTGANVVASVYANDTDLTANDELAKCFHVAFDEALKEMLRTWNVCLAVPNSDSDQHVH
jgi:hypothetical protein